MALTAAAVVVAIVAAVDLNCHSEFDTADSGGGVGGSGTDSLQDTPVVEGLDAEVVPDGRIWIDFGPGLDDRAHLQRSSHKDRCCTEDIVLDCTKSSHCSGKSTKTDWKKSCDDFAAAAVVEIGIHLMTAAEMLNHHQWHQNCRQQNCPSCFGHYTVQAVQSSIGQVGVGLVVPEVELAVPEWVQVQ